MIVVLFGLLLTTMGIDWHYRRIPHALTLAGLTVTFIVIEQLPVSTWQVAMVGSSVLFSLFVGIRVIGAWRFGRPVLGFGDVMLAAWLGAMGGVVEGLYAAAVGMLLAGLFSVWGLWRGRLQKSDSIPYGVFLAIGGMLMLMMNAFQ